MEVRARLLVRQMASSLISDPVGLLRLVKVPNSVNGVYAMTRSLGFAGWKFRKYFSPKLDFTRKRRGGVKRALYVASWDFHRPIV